MTYPHQTEVAALREQLSTDIVGQTALLDRLVIGLLTGGHLLLEGLPGLAKTTAVKALASRVHASFQRVQFTPDLLPGDLTGTEVFNPADGSVRFVRGPLFHDIVLADEINRAPAKVQSALLEAMQERQITVGGVSYPLPPLFFVLATQNPLEQAGTYALPEAQLDRFLLHVRLDYPAADEELRILQLHLQASDPARSLGGGPTPAVDVPTVLAARQEVLQVHVAESLQRTIVDLVRATRAPQQRLAGMEGVVAAGASPRAVLALAHAARALAYLRGRDFVLPDDVMALAPDVLRHRIVLSLDAGLREVSGDALIADLLAATQWP
ncbi:MAG: AAA family ATPase [Thiomonas arsenitoxydans]|uniref:AAA family ATPase n=1 Tax=Thiomonas arsenitoxydans (strain DSM 22701 / CIP 110005 / 3As) TaxID=426114 RepID=A0A8I1MWM2_THIA3|nr:MULTISPECIES: AAA family ATPase [Thiomonas]MBN8743357.1 AAA family ATPase [Thiomonas arsenitoxydans]ODU98433.1 MAG: AAA family ATPase [Thiomonas sp. SCN 64-16]